MDKIDNNVTQAPPTFSKTIGGTTYKVTVHFSQTSKETITDKITRMIQNDILYQNEKNSV